MPFTRAELLRLRQLLRPRGAVGLDQVVGEPRERGVALISARAAPSPLICSSNGSARCRSAACSPSAIRRDSPPRTSSNCSRAMSAWSAFGLYLEGVHDARRFAAAVQSARSLGKPIALVKAGRTQAASDTVRTHTGALSGADAAFDAFCAQAGASRAASSLATLCETLKIFHAGGPATRPAAARARRIRRGHGDDRRCRAQPRAHLPALPGAHAHAAARDTRRARAHREPLRLSHPHLV